MAVSLILNIPHASTNIPFSDEGVFLPHVEWNSFIDKWHHPKTELLNQKKESIRKEVLAMTDWYTDELFDHGLGTAIITPVSRLVCDTERLLHEEEEPMAKKGMGFCYQRGSQNQVIKEFPDTYKDEVLLRYYAPHHKTLLEVVEKNRFEGVLILDCHSFSPKPLPYEEDQSSDRPDICIGTDEEYTSNKLCNFMENFSKSRGYTVGINHPYTGTILPLVCSERKLSHVGSIMINVNRDLYLKPGTSEKSEGFQKLKSVLYDFEIMLLTVLQSYYEEILIVKK